MNCKKIILWIFLISSFASSMQGLDIIPDSTSTTSVSVESLRTYSKSAENPFYNKNYLLTHCFLLPNASSSEDETPSFLTKFVIVESTDENGNKEQLLWEINQSNGDNAKINPTIDIEQKTRFIITKNGASSKGSYPHKLIIPKRSSFIGVFFLDYLQTWQVESSSGDTVTLKALKLNNKSGGKISGVIDIPDTDTYDIKLTAGVANIFNKDDIITMAVERQYNSSLSRTSVTVTLINLTLYGTNSKSTATFVTGKFTQ